MSKTRKNLAQKLVAIGLYSSMAVALSYVQTISDTEAQAIYDSVKDSGIVKTARAASITSPVPGDVSTKSLRKAKC